MRPFHSKVPIVFYMRDALGIVRRGLNLIDRKMKLKKNPLRMQLQFATTKVMPSVVLWNTALSGLAVK
jgi:hypothetical protein